MSEKQYVREQLDKIIADEKYYMRSKVKTKDFIDKTSGLVERLKQFELNPEEKKQVSKMVNWLKKLREVIQ